MIKKFTPSELIEIPIIKGTTIDPNNIVNPDWWAKFDTKIKNNIGHEKVLSFKDGIGCYIFSIKKHNKITPWYVGKTEKQTFEKECFSDHKYKKYTEVLVEQGGIPMLTLIVKIKEKRLGLSKQVTGISELEDRLIFHCLRKNSKLSNVLGASKAKNLKVEGFTVNSFYKSKQGRPESRITNLKKILK